MTPEQEKKAIDFLREAMDQHVQWNDCSGSGKPEDPEDCMYCVWVKQFLAALESSK